MTTHPRDAVYESLPGPAAALYRQLGTCPLNWVDADSLAVLTELDIAAAQSLAETLVDVGLLDTVEYGFALTPDGYLHARLAAEDCEIDEQSLNGARLDRLFSFLKNAAGAAERLITPSHRPLWEREHLDEPDTEPPFPLEEGEALDWLEQQLPNYMAVIRYGFLDRRYALVCDLAYRLWPLWLRRRHPEQRCEALTLGLAAATLVNSDSAIGQMLTSLAGAVCGSNPIEAFEYNRRAALHYRETGDSMGLAQALNGLGKSLLGAGHFDQADQHFRDAEHLRIALGYSRGAALSRQGRGLVALARRDAAAAADHLLAAHETLLGAGDSYDAALTLAFHAEARAALGDLDGALFEVDMASMALGQATSIFGQAVVLETKARILSAAGHNESAEEVRAKALELRELSKESSFA